MSLQLSENIQSLIRSIIIKHPKLEGDILNLRGAFIDSVRDLNRDYRKVNKKYEKLKQRLKIQQQNSNQTSNAENQLFSTRSPRQKMSKKQGSPLSTFHSDYDIDLMSYILSEARSIKSIFQQTLKLTIHQKQQTISTTSIISVYNAYKDFYKSFKQKHKQYIENFSYDQKCIHKNSTQMKQRLIDELKKQMEKRKQLQENLSSLQNSIEKTLKHKNTQIQRLTKQLQQLKDNLKTISKQQKLSIQQKVQKKNKKGQARKSEESQKQTKFFNKENKKHKIIEITQQISDSQGHNSQIQNSQQKQPDAQSLVQYASVNQQNSEENQQISRLPNRSQLGRFYMGSDLISTGKLGSSQIRKSNNNKDQKDEKLSRNSDNFIVPVKQPKQVIKKRNEQHKMTFGNQGQVMNIQNDNKLNQRLTKQKSKDMKSSQIQMERLRRQLQKQRIQKQGLKQEIKQSDKQYRRLQEQVNELYKLMSDKQPQKANDKKQAKRRDKSAQSNTNNLRTDKISSIQNISTKKQYKQKKQPNYDECEDIEDIIAKAEKSFLQNNHGLNKTSPLEINPYPYQISFGDVISPISKKSAQIQINQNNNSNYSNRFVSPPKNIQFLKTQTLQPNLNIHEPIKTPTKNVRTNFNITPIDQIKSPLSKNQLKIDNFQQSKQYLQKQTQRIPPNKDISSLSIRSYSNNKITPYKNLPPMSSRNRLQNQMKAELQQIQQYYAERIKQKQQEALNFQQQAQKEQIKNNVLMMMLLTQAGALQEFILKQQQSQSYLID